MLFYCQSFRQEINMGDMVIAAYRPKPGKAPELLALTQMHIPYLRELDLVTDRPTLAMQGQDGTIIEVFEWRDGAIDRAHAMPEIHRLWETYAAVCDYTPLDALPESKTLFAQFRPLDL
jgi:hypothetical protein